MTTTLPSKLSGKDRYESVKHLGEGQFANVYLAKDLETGEYVAIKKIKLGGREEARDGVNRTALREIKLLQELRHDNIITLRNVFSRKNNIQLVFDFMETDLEQLLKNGSVILMGSHVKNMVMQMLLGVEFLHMHFILHRDLKPNNLLINSAGRMKVTDFGLARFFGSPTREYTHQVVTRWYRCPELLFGARAYGVGVDMWAVGCIIAELLLRVPLFQGDSDLDQLVKIFTVMGVPTDNDWAKRKSLPDYIEIKPANPIPVDLRSLFTAASDNLLELMRGCLRFDPLKRLTATEALNSAYFREEPFACDDEQLPVPTSENIMDYGTRKRRRFMDGDSPAARRNLFD
ncbi:unnamed protein product [Bursaphelenchus xylophilus]|uniref:Cyclin-dependent kinase 7 n=1 Tax=Bursaphelenchus xylophilus TaxID=6326 RepID=A0A1I7RKM9_BURXY|nr:unnamed protein product [Bursaphelenchus xylophilus]CAG9131216.1 unnamed protein product [Bursaphelenchus xylophilus]